ncbi:hypothetical protein [Burkholderia gladioli]|uniref:hypothetical protein n=1 Tax=Burkholderia gladioli TaxID=28095 RepID=UPI00163E44A5|nr:hypothetical protein [Burkholderia gladioli]
MSEPSTKRHPFLDDLDPEVRLVSSVLRRPVQGREVVSKIVKAGAAQYASQTPRSLDTLGERTYFEYEVQLTNGQHASGLVSIFRNAEGRVAALHIAFSPLDAVLSIAAGVRERLASEYDPGLFLQGESA